MDDHKVIWSGRSLKDLGRAHDVLAENSIRAANETVETILDRITQLNEFPESGPLEPSLAHRKKEHRYLVCGHHKIIYRIENKIYLLFESLTQDNILEN
ncbi:MAG: type II toxin-antitoxin system RelE/ParE family toxin [Cyclobacteriaceae bacterium]